ncbi:MAG TPA: DUF1761 domain-containing protein [Candidatus Baltobacteraceae bacterium]|nr:DUF1761 domain-containing protein [Candidatus Baltobacteraceae bacterium]
MLTIQGINYVAVVVAAVVAFVIGMVWFSPKLFGNDWAKDMSKTSKPKPKGGMMMGMVGAIISVLLTALVLEVLLGSLGITSMTSALELGFMVWLGFFFSMQLVRASFGGSKKMFTIMSAHDIIIVLVMSAILVAMG